MLSVINDNPFVVGDPVQAIHSPELLGKVVRITNAKYDWCGAPIQVALVFVKLIGRRVEATYYPEELCVCKCAARIPKGVSQWQK